MARAEGVTFGSSILITDIERPCRTGLICNVPRFISDCRGHDEKLVGLGLEALASPRHVDHGIDDDVGNMHTLRPQIPSHRLGEDALRRFCRGEACKIRATTLRRCISGDYDCAYTGGHHD